MNKSSFSPTDTAKLLTQDHKHLFGAVDRISDPDYWQLGLEELQDEGGGDHETKVSLLKEEV